MSTDRDVERIVRSWMDEGVTALPDRVLDAVLDQIPATPQRRATWLARRFPPMNSNIVRFGVAAAVIVLAVIVGINFLPGDGNRGGPPEPTSTPPLPSESLPTLTGGSYTVTNAGFTLVPYTFTVPDGWIRDDGGARKGDDVIDGARVLRLSTWIITHVYADSCHWTGTLVPVTDRASLVAALTAQVGHTHSTPVETTIGGLAATKITLSLDAAFDVATCDTAPNGDGIVRLWPDPGPDENGGWLILPGQTDTVFVIEANGEVMVLVTVQHQDSPAADVAALEVILNSVEFQP
jgi:hypothetical protein